MLITLSTDKTVSDTAATLQAAVQTNHFGVMQVHNLKETMEKKGIEVKQKLKYILPTGIFNAKEFLRLAASLEQASEHPLAAAMSLSSVSVISNALRLRKERL